MTPHHTPLFRVSVAQPDDRPVLENLWTMFQHDMSAFSGALPGADGRFRQDRLDLAFSDPGRVVSMLRLGEIPVGLVIVRGVHDNERVLGSFFLVHAARRRGFGLSALRSITRAHPGRWAVAFQGENVAAAQFWRRVATDAAGENWSEERQPVPGRADLPSDSWIRFCSHGDPTDLGL